MTQTRLLLEDPHGFLAWLSTSRQRGSVSLDDVQKAQVFAIAAVAALARRDGQAPLELVPASATGAGRFAHAIGLEEVVAGDAGRAPTERDRTVTLTRVRGRGPWEALAEQIVGLVLPRRPPTPASDMF